MYLPDTLPPSNFDILIESETPGDDPKKAAGIVRSWVDAGVTWCIEAMWEAPADSEGLIFVHKRIKQGPPSM